MQNRDNLPQQQGMLCRPRLDALIEEGLRRPLLVVLAGPGYGKTQAVSGYMAKCGAKVLWLRLNSLDNLHSYFWNHLTVTLRHGFPGSAGRLQALGFPDTPSKFNAFLRVFTGIIGRQRQVVWVFDDFGEISDRSILDFVRALAGAGLANFRLVLISNELARTEPVVLLSSNLSLLLGRDLCFTTNEISELFEAYDVLLEPDELREVERYTEGWPLPLHLLALQHGRLQELVQRDGQLTHQVISGMFEERFFSLYPQRQQRLLVKLSLLESFTVELAAGLYEGDKAELEAVENHVFLTAEPATGRLYFHLLYRLFLQSKKYLLTAAEERQLWHMAAGEYMARGNAFEAISCYGRCGDHVRMLGAIANFIRFQLGAGMQGIMAVTVEHLLKHLDLLTPEEAQRYPAASYIRALIYLSALQLEKAETLLLGLERELLAGGEPRLPSLLGDTCAMLGAIHMMRNQEDFGDFYKRAAGYLPQGTVLQKRRALSVYNNHSFSMADSLPGACERMERAVHYGVPWMSKVLCGGMSGMEHIFSAEAAYLACRFEDARQHACRGIQKAEEHAQHDLVCNGYIILARIGLMRGDYAQMAGQVQNVAAYADRYEINALNEIKDTALGWFYVRLGECALIPKSIAALNNADRPTLARDRSQIVYANYLVRTGEYARLVGMLEHPVGLYVASGIWPDRISLYILLAIAYLNLGNNGAATAALWTAYDMCRHNGLTALFIEAGDYMRSLVAAARQQHTHAFAPEWLAHIDEQAAAHARRAAAVRNAHKKQNPPKMPQDNPLTRREREVLQALALGLTREEIASQLLVSVNTVKTFIKSIYTKLDAANRAEAVSIAIARKYIAVFPSD